LFYPSLIYVGDTFLWCLVDNFTTNYGFLIIITYSIKSLGNPSFFEEKVYFQDASYKVQVTSF